MRKGGQLSGQRQRGQAADGERVAAGAALCPDEAMLPPGGGGM